MLVSYVDGAEVASQTNSPKNPTNHQAKFHFGRSYKAGGSQTIRHHVLVGAIDEVLVWNRRLSSSEIGMLFAEAI